MEQAYQYAEKLNQLNPARFVLEIISAQASYIDMLLELSEHDKALKAAIDLEALYTMQGVWGFQDLRTENSIGTAMVCGGLYELGVLNTSIAYYQNSNNAEALKFLQEAENIANELKELNQLFSSYPLVVRFAKGDLLAKLSQPGSEELLKAGLEYKSGTLPNDAVLLYLINDYRTNNNSIYRK